MSHPAAFELPSVHIGGFVGGMGWIVWLVCECVGRLVGQPSSIGLPICYLVGYSVGSLVSWLVGLFIP